MLPRGLPPAFSGTLTHPAGGDAFPSVPSAASNEGVCPASGGGTLAGPGGAARWLRSAPTGEVRAALRALAAAADWLSWALEKGCAANTSPNVPQLVDRYSVTTD